MFSSEQELLDYFIDKRSGLKRKRPDLSIIVPNGDDAAVVSIQKNHYFVATTDSLVEDVHFKIKWSTPEYIGKKAVLSNISDIAAMGARPLYSLISLIIPIRCQSHAFIKNLHKGLTCGFEKEGVKIIGGNVSQGEKLSITITLLGSINRKNTIFTRSNSSIDEVILATGILGQSALELELLNQGKIRQSKHLSESRIEFSRAISQARLASSCIDISDGLAIDLHRLCKASGVGALIFQNLLPVPIMLNSFQHPKIKEIPKQVQNDKHSVNLALYGGEDYELLFTAKKANIAKIFDIAKKTNTPVSLIGLIRHARFGLELKLGSGKLETLKPRGWDHFRPKADQPM